MSGKDCCKRFKRKGRPCKDCPVVCKLGKKQKKRFLEVWADRAGT